MIISQRLKVSNLVFDKNGKRGVGSGKRRGEVEKRVRVDSFYFDREGLDKVSELYERVRKSMRRMSSFQLINTLDNCTVNYQLSR